MPSNVIYVTLFTVPIKAYLTAFQQRFALQSSHIICKLLNFWENTLPLSAVKSVQDLLNIRNCIIRLLILRSRSDLILSLCQFILNCRSFLRGPRSIKVVGRISFSSWLKKYKACFRVRVSWIFFYICSFSISDHLLMVNFKTYYTH